MYRFRRTLLISTNKPTRVNDIILEHDTLSLRKNEKSLNYTSELFYAWNSTWFQNKVVTEFFKVFNENINKR